MTQGLTRPGGIPWRLIGWGSAAALLLLPLIAMRFTREVDWDETDFLFAAVLIAAVGGGFELAVRASASLAYRAGAAAALAVAFLTVWANAAVGMIGSEDNSYNLLFLAVLALALIGGVLARFRARGMALVMLLAGGAHLAVAIGGLAQDPRGGIFSAAFTFLWLLSAALFHLAGRRAPAGQ